MYIQLVRERFTGKTTIGRMFVNGTFECYTLEDKDRYLEDGGEKVYGKTAIPRGTYEIELTMSNRFKKILPLLKNVPYFTGVRIHTGNFAEDTDGCILVGTTDGDDFIGHSKDAFNSLYEKMKDEERITIEIV